MLRNAPKFYEVAKRIVEITSNCILVAHNAKFDYRILQTEFKRLGFDFERKTLCTVELSKQLIPDLPSYSLGKLVRSLGIPVSNRHRASGDAKATVKLFQLLLDKDIEKQIIKNAIRQNPKLQLEPKLLNIINKMPEATGVYFMHNANGEIIYIGKSKNIKKRINQHFTNTSQKSKKIQLHVFDVSYETTGSELVALLKESAAIKVNKPIFNRALRQSVFTYGLYAYFDANGYQNLKIAKITDSQKPITTFTNLQSAKHFMFKTVEKYNLCQKLTGLYTTTSNCFNYTIKTCNGACIAKESVTQYNKRVQQVLEAISLENKTMLLIDKGRTIDERSVIVIENGIFIGLGYFQLNYQIQHLEVLKNLITPMQNNKDTQHIINTYIRKNKLLRIINLNPTTKTN